MVLIELLQPYQYEAFRQWRANGDAFILEVIRQKIAEHEQGQIQMLVALDDGQLVGTVQLAFNHPDTAADPKSGYVQALEIHHRLPREVYLNEAPKRIRLEVPLPNRL
jgi:hypothetical protein